MTKKYDVIIIGGGSAGMAAALKAREQVKKVLLLERSNCLGGILNQCVHNGFGLNYFKKEMTGPEYANAFIDKVKKSDIDVMLETTALKISEVKTLGGKQLFSNKSSLKPMEKKDYKSKSILGSMFQMTSKIKDVINLGGKKQYSVTTLSPAGKITFNAKSIVLAMGCRERPAGAINLCGTRPAGVLSAGCAQKLINIYGKKVGNRVVIIGSGDIGLIMARRMLYEGAKVLGVYEVQPYPSGLKRNIVQCLEDYNIPLYLSKTIVEVVGNERVEGIYVAPVKEDFSLDLSKKEFIKCDTVILSVGLVPENSIASKFGVTIDSVTGGAVVDENLQTSRKGIFSCGNVLHVHDIVDNVSREAETAGTNAGLFAKGKLDDGTIYNVICGNGIRYTVPKTIYKGKGVCYIRFRVGKIFKDCKLAVSCNGKDIVLKDRPIMLPAEMETLVVDKSKITGDITLSVREV